LDPTTFCLKCRLRYFRGLGLDISGTGYNVVGDSIKRAQKGEKLLNGTLLFFI